MRRVRSKRILVCCSLTSEWVKVTEFRNCTTEFRRWSRLKPQSRGHNHASRPRPEVGGRRWRQTMSKYWPRCQYVTRIERMTRAFCSVRLLTRQLSIVTELNAFSAKIIFFKQKSDKILDFWSDDWHSAAEPTFQNKRVDGGGFCHSAPAV